MVSEKKAFTPPDFEALFAASPNPYLVLSAERTIVAVSDTYLRATMTRREDILGHDLFDVFPDNPDDPKTTGTGNLNTSLLRVIEYRQPDAMAIQKYDIRRPDSEGGGFEARYWSPLNTPVLGPDGAVKWIIHYVEDVTAAMREKIAESERQLFARQQQSLIDQLRTANRALLEKSMAAG